MDPETKTTTWATPVAIVLAGALIAGAVYVKNSPVPTTSNQATVAESLKNLKTVDKTDRVRGSVSAPIKLIEYSDLECPFCKTFHRAMIRLMAKYEGRVAWVYRHFPLDSIHPK